MEPPEVTQWQTYTEIYLMENRLTELPQDPRCPVLLVLFLNRNYKLRTISQSFFDCMPALEILNLSRTRIKSLPESLFGLSCLKRLFLTHCEMLSVLPPKIGELQQLEVLDMEGTEIMDLPQEVAKLTKLTCLELSFCPRVNRGTKSAKANALIPQGTLSALSQLEELSIDVNPEDESLDTLKMYLPRVEHLRKFKWFGTFKVCRLLSHFKFIVGSHDERIMSCLPVDLEFEIERWDRSLKYVNGVGVPIDIQKMLRHATAFFLDRHTDVTKLSDFGIENMEQLKCCIIGECNEIRVIIDGTMYDETDRSEIVSETWDYMRFLESLEYLYVYHMKSLRCIYEGPPRRGSLSHLKCLALVTCPQLTTIFTLDLLKNLDSLEELKVEDCPHVSSLVTCEDTPIDDSTHFLANMKRISLFSLPELISISSGLRIAPNLERMSIIDCPNLKSPSPDEICCSPLTGAKVHPNLVKLIGYCVEGCISVKSDVYSFGVVLSEILTGRKPYDFTDDGLLLVGYVRSHLEKERSLYELIDSRLGNQFSGKGAQITFQLAVRCLQMDPDARPWMSEVVEVLKTIQDLPYTASTSNIQDKTGKR
ncbi:hypothetical protein EUGRSUZ_H05018 [Eucalyptus grandis]|uniref:Uncharacterized protein n=2 Tax=Eucalyptus grandis TaxID=71139 RepID=A0ACC3K4U5_EUCGR|nr:hypothetical protein EUGRSUZ_H05018 [Eucalyptus grandis]